MNGATASSCKTENGSRALDGASRILKGDQRSRRRNTGGFMDELFSWQVARQLAHSEPSVLGLAKKSASSTQCKKTRVVFRMPTFFNDPQILTLALHHLFQIIQILSQILDLFRVELYRIGSSLFAKPHVSFVYFSSLSQPPPSETSFSLSPLLMFSLLTYLFNIKPSPNIHEHFFPIRQFSRNIQTARQRHEDLFLG